MRLLSGGVWLIAGLALASAVRPLSANITTIPLVTPSQLSFTDSAGTQFALTATQPAGSGTFQPFMRMQRDDAEQGYNSSANNGPTATMDLVNLPGNSSSQLPLNSILTDDFRVLLTLDYNETGSGTSTISLEDLTLVVSTDPNKTGPAGPANNGSWSIQSIPMSASDQVVYQMSSQTDGSGSPFDIQMDANKNLANGNGGSGAADLNVSVDLSQLPNLASLLDGQHYLYVYSRFSDSQAGFEEWKSFQRETPFGSGNIPEPASLAFLSLGALGLLRRRRNA